MFRNRSSISFALIVIVIVSGCIEQGVELETSVTKTDQVGTSLKSSPAIVDQYSSAKFLVKNLGQEYFQAHYSFINEIEVSSDVVKAIYSYTNSPHVKDFKFTFFLNITNKQLSDQETSIILLEPQEFLVDRDEAIQKALETGLVSTPEAYETKIIFGPETQNRFAWFVSNPEALPEAEDSTMINQVVLDVESGEIYSTGTGGVGGSHN